MIGTQWLPAIEVVSDDGKKKARALRAEISHGDETWEMVFIDQANELPLFMTFPAEPEIYERMAILVGALGRQGWDIAFPD